ncbi:MAG: PD-(D/E)XK nuclease family transposase [Myxococcales bacterium]
MAFSRRFGIGAAGWFDSAQGRRRCDDRWRGQDYTELPRCISILWFKVPLLTSGRFHTIISLAAQHSHEIFADELEIHVLELPNLHLAASDRQAKLERWARFLRATTVRELEELAREDATMSTAKKALEDLSMDPEARRIASARETAVLMHQHLLAASRKAGLVEGEAKGRAEGEAKGRAEGESAALRSVIASICGSLGVELTAERTSELARLNTAKLKRLTEVLLAERRWSVD